MTIRYFLTLLFTIVWTLAHSQCAFTVNTFPYSESFEAGPSGWVSGGLSNDWAWGTPNKGFIQNAGAGTKCWVTGGLNGSFYNFGQRSYVTSPCFDFTNLQYPHIKMKVYWEGENQYDGTTFQYSLNNGATWDNVGTNTDPVDCLNENWFNQVNINALNTLANPKHGWAGTVQPTAGGCFGGNGSGGWVTAQHCMSNLAGQPNVMFRFAFGAGTICNDFDGFGFDEIVIGNAPANNADFTFACTANSLEYQFTNGSAYCPTNFSWNFGDPLSGPNNTSNAINPTHQFSAPGTYQVTLTVAGPCNQSSTITKTIVTLNAIASSTNPLCTNQANGSVTVNLTGNNGLTNYSIQPGGSNNSIGYFNGLTAGNYTITATDASGCSITTSASLVNPPTLNWSTFQSTNITCNGLQNGQITANASGGSGTLTYLLSPSNTTNTSGNFAGLGPSTYTITATDINNCSISSITSLTQPALLQINSVNVSHLSCYNSNNGSIQTNVSGGNPGLNFTLNPGNQTNTNGNFTNLSAGSFTITVVDSKGCSTSSAVVINNAPQLTLNSVNTIQPSCIPGNDGSITVQASGGTGSIEYSIGGIYSSNNTFSGLIANTYTITIKDANNCAQSTLVTLQNPNSPIVNSITKVDASCYELENGSITIVATGIAPILEYLIQPGNVINSNGFFENLKAGIYTITLKDANGCTVTTTETIFEPNKLEIIEKIYKASPCNSSITGTLAINVTGGSNPKNFTLTPGNISNQNGVFDIKTAGNYFIKIVDANNCELNTTYNIPETICCGNVIVPNAFSPNDDGRNDELRLINTSGIEVNKFNIYNRWGQIAFEGQHAEDRWDGKMKGTEASVGTYFYLVEYKCLSDQKTYLLKGDVMLIR